MATSQSRKHFEKSFYDIDCLIDLYNTLIDMEGDDGDGDVWDFKDHKTVVLKSSIVLMVSHWEAYVEDICSEAIEHIVASAENSDKLPKDLKKQIAKEIRSNQNELKMWDLSGKGWKEIISQRINEYHDQRNWKFNSPKSQQVINFYNEYLGIKDISKNWSYENLTVSECKDKLNEIVEVRGAIAHRGHPPKTINLKLTKEYSAFLKSIIGKTGGSVNSHVKKICGTGLF